MGPGRRRALSAGETETAYAKINLALHVRGRMPGGYHRIETLFAFCEHGDALTAEPADDLSLVIDGPFALGLSAGSDNLVVKAASALRYAVGGGGAALRLTKSLPVASGIGGGSADAAATLRLLARLWSVDLPDAEMLAIARTLGADAPACLASVTARGDDRGDRLTPVSASLSGVPVLLVNPRFPLSTAAVFATWDGIDRGPISDGFVSARNDLQASAMSLQPAIAKVLRLLNSLPGATLVRMSGSGATCFALFADADARDEGTERIARAEPDWWRLRSRLR